jgi:hypothetical protein
LADDRLLVLATLQVAPADRAIESCPELLPQFALEYLSVGVLGKLGDKLN